jgi:hypothetical protein
MNATAENNSKKELSFKEQSKRGKLKNDEDGESNNTSIKWYATAKNSMDGKRIFRSLIDEASKFQKDVPNACVAVIEWYNEQK